MIKLIKTNDESFFRQSSIWIDFMIKTCLLNKVFLFIKDSGNEKSLHLLITHS